MEGPELDSLRDECPELRGVPTAVYTEEQVTAVREIIEYVGPIMDMLELDMMQTSDGPTTVKMNPARGIVPQVRWQWHVHMPTCAHHDPSLHPSRTSLALTSVCVTVCMSMIY